MLILGQVDTTLITSQFNDIGTIQFFFSHDFYIYVIICMKKNNTIYTFKNSTPLRLLGKIHALSTEVL